MYNRHMENNWIIDGHEDLSYESLYGKFDYRRPASETRRLNQGPEKFSSMIGWPEMQKGQIGIIFSTIFLAPPDHAEAHNINRKTSYQTPEDFHAAVIAHMDFYENWEEKEPDMFRVLRSKADYEELSTLWQDTPVNFPQNTHPVGLVYLMEGAEGLRSLDDLELYKERGLRLLGPVWEGGRWCAGTFSREKDELTRDGRALLERMAELGLVLDISHMKNHSALAALDAYDGTVIASHANCENLLPGMPYERHLRDETILKLAERDGVMGVIPFNAFLKPDWEKIQYPRSVVRLDTLIDHIDHICQLCGNSDHAAIGSDADGGFGYPDIPEEMNDISDLQKLAGALQKRGFSEMDISKIFHGNWQRILERALS